eukprot:TRINITY_DN1429_c0_g1_i6.p1 TRINITY_DN1429_c0_g1~~TRINITY_DN1429_c0_g1_i6.p1  ORF type:complete len:332 (+),score=62.53 TRINITY_DN1429_c0_g1_i6:311-1306(+)
MLHNTTAKLKGALQVPDNYRILLMSGGAVGQFSSIPMNLAFNGTAARPKVDIVPVGYWSTRATDEAAKYCDVHHPIEPCHLTVPPVSEWRVRPDAEYVHIALNETVEGLEFLKDPAWEPSSMPPLIADATSTLLSRPIDVSRYGAIYASGGKNIPHGVTVMIIRDDLLDRTAHPLTPQVLHFNSHGAALKPIGSAHDSMPNTPPVFPSWMLGLMLDHIEHEGGVSAMEQLATSRAAKLYDVIDESNGFYTNFNDPGFRSRMSVVFRVANGDAEPNRELEAAFLAQAEAEQMFYLFGHPVKGGLRATCYLGQRDEAVDGLVELMHRFKKAHQ